MTNLFILKYLQSIRMYQANINLLSYKSLFDFCFTLYLTIPFSILTADICSCPISWSFPASSKLTDNKGMRMDHVHHPAEEFGKR